MASPVETIQSGSSVMEAIEVMIKRGTGSVVVVDGNIPLGIFTRHDFMSHIAKLNLEATRIMVDKVMSKPPIMVKPEESIVAVTEKMERWDVSNIVITDKKRQLLGVITETDIRLRFSRGYLSHKLLLKKFVVDTFAYISFWSWIVFMNQVVIVGIEWNKFITSSIIGFFITILLGGPFGRYLDIFRQKFNV